ncbi:MAG: hypothetical protein K9J85_01445 [Desulfobacteraceae bacterium]|nr:hypothetical protein [Desulfobacteraceae bacterium]
MHNKTMFTKLIVFFVLVLFGVAWLAGCGEKEALLEISDYEFSIEKSESDYVVNAKGTIVNKGEVDVKNVEVTGYCRSCSEEIVGNEWFVSDYAKMEHQKDVIASLPAGASENFEFGEVAFFSPRMDKVPEDLPESLEISIESYEIAK